MASHWEIPPVTIIGKSHKSADFVLWMQTAPIVSTKAKEALESLYSDLLEFLPFHSVRGVPHFAMNVLCCDSRKPIHKADLHSAIFVNDEFGGVLKDRQLSGVELADPSENIGRKIVRGECVNVFPGLIG